MKFEAIKRFYLLGVWNEKMLEKAKELGKISSDEFFIIKEAKNA